MKTCSCSESDLPALIKPNEDLLRKYVESVIKPRKQEKVLKILVDHSVAHPSSFKSKTITKEKLLKWGLSDGIVAQLRDNVSVFEETSHYISVTILLQQHTTQ
ncbi:hypothetical protein PSTG_02585 [Puccinia striiformis f. sp. tritici PST-78]|uniref:Uncharacterized protein n=1 Tax=Puccinia striiformis f. sp. tritici PST-78 TaxID=1165861 RepID=A0A0L0VY90_9BASI|nr:hypothetical protein PSTG_02585 [Puccinia striiformis f. sp. tritici PST-78]